MSKKEEPAKVSDVVHVPGEFQFTREILHIPAKVNRKSLGLEFGFVADGIADKMPIDAWIDAGIYFLNNIDWTHDKKSDVAQAAPYVIKMLPYIKTVAPLINPKGVIAWMKTHPTFFTDAVAAHAQLDAVVALAEDAAAKLTPKQ